MQFRTVVTKDNSGINLNDEDFKIIDEPAGGALMIMSDEFAKQLNLVEGDVLIWTLEDNKLSLSKA